MEYNVCLICTAPMVVLNLGVQACRACASFFKRTVITGRKFICRQGEKKCKIRKHEKFMCRSCRYDMCVELGMSYALPAKRKPRKTEQSVHVASNNSHSKADSEKPSSSSTVRLNKEDSMIDRMAAEYRASYDRRLIQEKAYAVKHNLEPINYPNQKFFMPTFTAYYEIFKIAIQNSIAILQNVFDDFNNFLIEHRVTLFKNFYNKFSMLECSYYTSMYFPKSKNMFMGSLITCNVINDTEQWIDNSNMARKDAFRVTLKSFIDEYMDLFGPMAKMDELTEREFHAVAILNYCDIDTTALPEEIIAKARNIRATVFKELQEYYRKDLKLHDFSNRLGNLMTLAHGAGEAGILMKEEMRMYSTMFDVLSDDRLLREFFTN